MSTAHLRAAREEKKLLALDSSSFRGQSFSWKRNPPFLARQLSTNFLIYFSSNSQKNGEK